MKVREHAEAICREVSDCPCDACRADLLAAAENAIRAAGEPLAAALRALVVAASDLDLRDAYEHGAGGRNYVEDDAIVAARAALAEWEKEA